MPCGRGLLARSRGKANLPAFAPQRLKQAGGGSEPRINRLVDAMFFENVGRDERQLVNGPSEFRGHASRSNGHEANSGVGRGNLQLATERTSPMDSLKTDIHRMTTLARVKLQLFKDFGNANSSTRGLPCTHAGDIGATSAENTGLVVIQTHLSVGF